MSFVRGTFYILPRIDNSNIDKEVILGSCGELVVPGLSFARGVGMVLGLLGPRGCPWLDKWVLLLHGGVLRLRGPVLHHYGRVFLVFFFHWRWPCWPLISKK